jgi:hypothetical protein
MAVQAARLETEVSIKGVSQAQGDLEKVGKKTQETQGFLDRLKHGFEFGLGLKLADIPVQGMGMLRDTIVDVIRAGMDQQQVMADTTQTLKTMGGASGQTSESVEHFAESMSHVTKFSDDMIQHGENVMLTFGNIGKNIFPQATTAAMNMSQKLGTDLQSSIIQVGKALNDPIQGVGALQRVGVSFTESEKAQIKTMMDHKNIAGAQGIVMMELSKQFGGVAVAAGKTAAGALQIASNRFQEIKEKIGTAVLPILASLATFITTQVIPAAEKFGQWFGDHVVPVLKSVAEFIGKVISVGAGIVGFFKNSEVATFALLIPLGMLAAVLIQMAVVAIIGLIAAIPGMVAGFIAWAGAAWAAAAGTIAATWPILAIGAVIALVVAGIILAVKHWGAIMDWIKGAVHTVGTFIGGIFSWLGTQVHMILTAIGAKFKWVGDFIGSIFHWIGNLIHAEIMGWSAIFHWIGGIFSGIGDFFHRIIDKIGGAFRALGGLIAGVWSGIVGSIRGAINWIIGLINGFIRGLDAIHIDVGPIHVGFSIPQIPYLQAGGFIESGGLAMLHAGERVIPASGLVPASVSSGGGGYNGPSVVNINIAGHNVAKILMSDIVREIRTATGVKF